MMKTAMRQLLDKLSECIKAGQDIEKLIPMLSNQYLPIERQQIIDAYYEAERQTREHNTIGGASYYRDTYEQL